MLRTVAFLVAQQLTYCYYWIATRVEFAWFYPSLHKGGTELLFEECPLLNMSLEKAALPKFKVGREAVY